MAKTKGQGWFGEIRRHSAAAKEGWKSRTRTTTTTNSPQIGPGSADVETIHAQRSKFSQQMDYKFNAQHTYSKFDPQGRALWAKMPNRTDIEGLDTIPGKGEIEPKPEPEKDKEKKPTKIPEKSKEKKDEDTTTTTTTKPKSITAKIGKETYEFPINEKLVKSPSDFEERELVYNKITKKVYIVWTVSSNHVYAYDLEDYRTKGPVKSKEVEELRADQLIPLKKRELKANSFKDLPDVKERKSRAPDRQKAIERMKKLNTVNPKHITVNPGKENVWVEYDTEYDPELIGITIPESKKRPVEFAYADGMGYSRAKLPPHYIDDGKSISFAINNKTPDEKIINVQKQLEKEHNSEVELKKSGKERTSWRRN
jgi:hypothetical protein